MKPRLLKIDIKYIKFCLRYSTRKNYGCINHNMTKNGKNNCFYSNIIRSYYELIIGIIRNIYIYFRM